jgi:hypothetical protein
MAATWGDESDQRKRGFTLAGAPPVSMVQQQVLRRETAESGAISEVLATIILLSYYAAEEPFPHDCPLQISAPRTWLFAGF